MKIWEIMSKNVITVAPEEAASVAARLLTRNDLGVLPVCRKNGQLCGVLTDRDVVTRCVAAGRSADTTTVGEIMTGQVCTVTSDMDVDAAARLMAQRKVRRLPVTERGRLRGMVTLADLSRREETVETAVSALAEISNNVT